MTLRDPAVPLQLWSLQQRLHWPGPFSKMTWLTPSMAMGCPQVFIPEPFAPASRCYKQRSMSACLHVEMPLHQISASYQERLVL